MVPLTFMNIDEISIISRIDSKKETKDFLEKLGFVEGSEVSLVSKNNGNIIVNIRGTRMALDKQIASKIKVRGI